MSNYLMNEPIYSIEFHKRVVLRYRGITVAWYRGINHGIMVASN
jgi:hypothetical protein